MDIIAQARPAKTSPLAPDTYEKLLSVGALILFCFVIAALVRGRSEWGQVPLIVWPHLVSIMIAVGLTPVMLLRRRGDRLHRGLGWLWASAMIVTAAASLFVRNINSGGFSIIHILSLWTLLQVPIIVWTARHHNVARHRRSVRAMVTGALLIAGFFTFPFNRMLGHWLFA
ncbi:hypothetical protein [Sphingomonas sp.]|uniref:DUF2306 domain-containing protein n=1 Tax=Sphingomonas sp. TaxID=28214 RepID=UPI00286A483D|nr:hypothetical protein [Sphingomonas sp.]